MYIPLAVTWIESRREAPRSQEGPTALLECIHQGPPHIDSLLCSWMISREERMKLGSQARVRLGTLPTPLHEAPRLRDALGGAKRCPRILLKRDDLTGMAFGGNKVRKLEFLVADAIGKGATCLVTGGAVQSNHARCTAAAARISGMGSALVLTTGDERPANQGNLLLDRLLGAQVRLVPEGMDVDSEMAKIAAELQAHGERPYVIPVGGSNAIGALGYVAAALELAEQLYVMGEAPSLLYYASGSRGTQAGLTLGAKLVSATYRLQGIAVSGGEPEKTARALHIANQAAATLGVQARLETDELVTDEGYIGAGYGLPTEKCLAAMTLLARHEAVFLDPVYSGKAMAGLINHIRSGLIDPAETVVFLHTGGTPALFALAEQIEEALHD